MKASLMVRIWGPGGVRLLLGGWIGAAGEMLVCLPNEIVIRLPGQRAGAIDAVAR